MSTANAPGRRRSRTWAMRGLTGFAASAATALGAATWLADSPYAIPLAHRPLANALLTLASTGDVFEGVKLVVILGASWPLMLDAAAWLLGRPAGPPARAAVRTASAPPVLGLEAAP
jgi:hypothetical protein